MSCFAKIQQKRKRANTKERRKLKNWRQIGDRNWILNRQKYDTYNADRLIWHEKAKKLLFPTEQAALDAFPKSKRQETRDMALKNATAEQLHDELEARQRTKRARPDAAHAKDKEERRQKKKITSLSAKYPDKNSDEEKVEKEKEKIGETPTPPAPDDMQRAKLTAVNFPPIAKLREQ